LIEVIRERVDYLWFLDYGLDDEVPNHSVLSKARARWGKEVFESLFVRTVAQCVEAGLKSRISIRFFDDSLDGLSIRRATRKRASVCDMVAG
jgi:hypothetical protein